MWLHPPGFLTVFSQVEAVGGNREGEGNPGAENQCGCAEKIVAERRRLQSRRIGLRLLNDGFSQPNIVLASMTRPQGSPRGRSKSISQASDIILEPAG